MKNPPKPCRASTLQESAKTANSPATKASSTDLHDVLMLASTTLVLAYSATARLKEVNSPTNEGGGRWKWKALSARRGHLPTSCSPQRDFRKSLPNVAGGAQMPVAVARLGYSCPRINFRLPTAPCT